MKIYNYIHSKRNDIVNELKRLMEVASVNSKAEINAPYGTECRKALDVTNEIYSSYGYKSEYAKDGGYLLTHYGSGEKTIGIFSHSDVVPVDNNWTVTKPFEPKEIDGTLFGRGSLDDKSGIIAALFAVNAIRDLKIPLKNKLLLFTGSNEESGMGDIEKFVKDEKMPDVSLVPDCAFPVYRGEKGTIRFWAKSKNKLSYVKNINGGTAFNIVLGNVKMTVPFSDEIFNAIKNSGLKFIKENDSLIIEANGISKHAALPEGSQNALSVLIDILKLNDITLKEDNETLLSVSELLKDYYGNRIKSFSKENEAFGKNTIVNGIVKVDDGQLCFAFDVRHINEETELLLISIKETFENIGFDIQIERNSEGFLISQNNKYLQALLKTYSECTGTANPQPRVNAGGTYARHLKNAFSVGTCLLNYCPIDLPSGHGGVHQPDEYININGFLDAIVIIIKMIVALDKEL